MNARAANVSDATACNDFHLPSISSMFNVRVFHLKVWRQKLQS